MVPLTDVDALLHLAHGGTGWGASAGAAWLVPVLVTGPPAALYLLGVARMRRNGRGWSARRTAGFGLGLLLVAAALSPPVDAGASDARGHMVQHLLLGMYAPIALVLGAPVTLLLAALPVRCRRPLAAVLRSRLLHVLSHVTTAAVLSVGALYLLYLTPLYGLTAGSELLSRLLHLHLLVAGYLWAWAVAGPDPAPRRPGMRVRIATVLVAGGAHAFLAKLLYARAAELPVGGIHGSSDVELAAQWMYYGGHVAELLLLTALFAGWYRRTRPVAPSARPAEPCPPDSPPSSGSAVDRGAGAADRLVGAQGDHPGRA